jgi:hypothetical protein
MCILDKVLVAKGSLYKPILNEFSTKDKTVTGQPQSGQFLGDVDLRSDLNIGAVCGKRLVSRHPLAP